ncbi:DUF1569 domain-containing protein [Paenibacillus radicis (ex Gao et al. 2016)]|uniref:DUF1569 domain-containing protein n=1 Tax=Paenibacillus radicis (ex Gao et al. 2016) TaxID=1737354 RepID=A0A917HPK5_9BACL|nr:DUF1569 domain-containing protein [Paenibacillus radicis (ex Gao et al. 2016)]GGG86248.1 hypothetical protein GCM10010918_50520 [Paenibacillus radicis (ex Gao et al. 2016)]
MKNIFDRKHTNEILARINKLDAHSEPHWGKMNVAQMLAHCSAFQDIASGVTFPKRSWLGVVVGGFAKSIVYNDKPLPRNMSTIPTILIADKRDFEKEKELLKQKTDVFQRNGPERCTTYPHPFFGKLTSEQWGICIYKHLDHHLKQFGV